MWEEKEAGDCFFEGSKKSRERVNWDCILTEKWMINLTGKYHSALRTEAVAVFRIYPVKPLISVKRLI
jgi:hypothetical protein